MFAAIAGEGRANPHEIAAMASALPGTGPFVRTWIDPRGGFSAAAMAGDILPEDLYDCQPFADDDLCFVCRVRLDSRADLLALLRIDPVSGAALSDGDILRHAFCKWREDTPRHIYGDFAFVAWERGARRIVAATDHLSTFPLFYSLRGPTILMATSIAALMAHPRVEAALDVRALGLIAAGKVGQGWTMFEGLRHLPAGELFSFQDGRLSSSRWWNPETTARLFYKRRQDYVDEVRGLFDAAVATRLRARGEIAATLSGGLDSTLVAATAARQLAGSDRSLHVFTSVPEPGLPVEQRPGWDPDDTPWAASVARLYANMRHSLVSPQGTIPLDILPSIHAVSRTPLRNTANLVWGWKISQMAGANGARVVLCGDHGNASFSYVGGHGDAGAAGRVAGMSRAIWDRLNRPHLYLRVTAKLRASAVRKTAGQTLRPGAAMLLPCFATRHREDLLQVRQPVFPRHAFVEFLMAGGKAPRPDFRVHFGVDWRDPTGDRRMLERLLAFPLHAFEAGNRSRGLARELGRGLLPESVRLRRTRGAQSPDEAAWFALRTPDYRKAFEDIRRSDTCGSFLNMAQLQQTLEALYAGRGSGLDAMVAHRALDAGLFAAAFEQGKLYSGAGLNV